MSEKIIIALISASVSIITVILTSVLNHFIKKDRKSKDKFTINIYNFPNKESITNPEVEIGKNGGKNQEKEIEREGGTTRKDSVKDKEQSENNQEMSQQKFEELLMKVKFITFGIMGNIKWDKVEPLKFRKDENDKQTALLVFEVEKKSCWIAYEITEKDKQKFLKTNTSEIVERFITLRLIHYGKNGYFDYHCPDCKQTTLTKSSVVDNPGEEAISCVLCGWAMSMKVYQEYLNDKKHSPSLEYYEWLGERNRRMVRTRREKA